MNEPQTYAVRLGMSVDEAAELGDLSLRVPPDVADAIGDQFWLLAVLVEQRRRTDNADRAAFDVRANGILEKLDPQETAAPEPVDRLRLIEQSLIDAVVQVGPWRHLSDEEKATDYRAAQVREIVEIVRAHDHQGAVDKLREVYELILKADVGDWDRAVPTLAQYAEAGLRELGGQSEVRRGDLGCTCGTPPFAPPVPASDCPHHGTAAA